jgi:hypothetical protein
MPTAVRVGRRRKGSAWRGYFAIRKEYLIIDQLQATTDGEDTTNLKEDGFPFITRNAKGEICHSDEVERLVRKG